MKIGSNKKLYNTFLNTGAKHLATGYSLTNGWYPSMTTINNDENQLYSGKAQRNGIFRDTCRPSKLAEYIRNTDFCRLEATLIGCNWTRLSLSSYLQVRDNATKLSANLANVGMQKQCSNLSAIVKGTNQWGKLDTALGAPEPDRLYFKDRFLSEMFEKKYGYKSIIH